jgi:hypothetical protein
MENLFNKKVLLISLKYFSHEIINELNYLGADVTHIVDKPMEFFFTKAFGRLNLWPYTLIIRRYYLNAIKNLKNTNFYFILVLRGEYTPKSALQLLKRIYPNSKLILYMWDSLKKYKKIVKKWNLYDKIWTFDRIDYNKHRNKINFLPLFYYSSFLVSNNTNILYDLAFIGTAHNDRITILNQIKKYCDQNGLSYYFYLFLPHKLLYYTNKLTNRHYFGVKASNINYRLLPLEEVYSIYSRSKCIIDIQSPNQTGLTMRTIEIIGLKKKLITTNEDIINYPFYSSQNIQIINRKKPFVDLDFLKKPHVELQTEIYEQYSLSNWLITLLKN